MKDWKRWFFTSCCIGFMAGCVAGLKEALTEAKTASTRTPKARCDTLMAHAHTFTDTMLVLSHKPENLSTCSEYIR